MFHGKKHIQLKQEWTQVIVAAALAISMVLPVAARAQESTLGTEERDSRIEHAHELLGKYYRHSVVRSGEGLKKVNGMIYRWARESLPHSYRKQYQKIAQTIIDQSLKYDFDPVFVTSVIVNESSFNPTQVGGVGEIGLMQLRPSTGKWMAGRVGIAWKGKSTLKDPIKNIKLGTAFLAYLRGRFDSHARLYLAAYNMGQANVTDALSHRVWPKDYPRRVMRHYVEYYRQIREQMTAQDLGSESDSSSS